MSIFDFFKKTTLLDLFVIRHEANERNTNKILNVIRGAVDALHEQMKIVDVEKQGGALRWDDVSYVDDGENQLLILVGIISYPPGTEIETLNGDIVKLTVDTAPFFNRLVRAGIPVSMAEKSKEQVIAYLQQLEEDPVNNIQPDADFGVDETMPQSDKPEEKEMTFDEFDLSQLTEEQRKSYEMGGKSGKA